MMFDTTPPHTMPIRNYHKFTDTPMLRADYRNLMKQGLRILGRHYDSTDFREMVAREMEYQGVQTTAQNWVSCAREVVEQLEKRQDREPDADMAEAE